MKKSVFRLAFSLVVFMFAAAVFADAPISGRAGRAEVRFMEGMIDHHQMALDMAQDCLAKAESEAVQELCQAVIAAQTPEIEQMQNWLKDWYNVEYAPIAMYPFAESNAMGGHQHGNAPATDPAMMMGMMAGLNRLEGIEYEIAWLESMIDHHDDALHMSERILQRAEHPELIELANNIIAAQTAEIALMESMIAEMSADS